MRGLLGLVFEGLKIGFDRSKRRIELFETLKFLRSLFAWNRSFAELDSRVDGLERVEILLGHRIEFVIVATGASDGQA